MEFSIKDVFDKVSQRMRIDFEESRDALNHPTLKGDAAEEIVRDFFKKYLPKNLTITSGIVIDSEGHFSKQIDIIICDAFKSPVFYEKKDIRVIPIETVYAVIEVKSVLKGGQISSICDNMNSIKKMKKQAFYIPSGAIIKKYKFYDSYTDHFPVLYFIFAFSAENPTKICQQINLEHLKRNFQISNRIDLCCILDEYVFLNATVDENSNVESVVGIPNDKTTFSSYPTKNALLLFYSLISNYLFQASCFDFKMKDYLGNMVF